MNKQKLTSIILSTIAFVLFLAYAAYILIGMNADVLYTAQDRNLYLGGSLYFCETVSRPFGLFQYAGAYLTQLFYYPALGAGVLMAIWVAIMLAGIKVFRLSGAWCTLMILPAACLLTSVVDLGYWVYCLIIPGYWFSQSLAILCLLLLLWAAQATPHRYRPVWNVIVGFVGFPVFGWVSYVFSVCLFLLQIGKEPKMSWMNGPGVVLAAVAPLVFRALLFSKISLLQISIAGFPYFKTFTDESLRPSIPFFVLLGIFAVLSLGGIFARLSSKRIVSAFAMIVPFIVAAASGYGVWTGMYKDQNYIYEMQMNRATMDDDWQTVISVAEKAQQPSRTMVMLKNIALFNTGQLAERSFELGNSGIEISNIDSLNLSTMQIASPAIYYNHGKINYAIRWCMEFAVTYGFSPYYFKNLARCAEATGEKELAQRYLNRLHSTMFYADWQPKPASPVVKELYTAYPDLLSDDANNCERYLLENISAANKVNSPLLCEISLVYSMITRTNESFWQSFCNYYANNKGKKLPQSVDEAFCLFMDRAPVIIPYDVKPSPETIARYSAFMEAGNSFAQYYPTEEAVAEAMREDWGRSYWWFNAFGRSKY